MSLREELEKAIKDVGHATDVPHTSNIDWARGTCALLIQTHGQALLEAVDRAMRYEAIRKMNPPTFTKVYMHNVETNIPFDTLVDTWAFNNGYPSRLDTDRSKTVDGGGV